MVSTHGHWTERQNVGGGRSWNTTPLPCAPPCTAVPYNAPSGPKMTRALGLAPSEPLKV